jgi:hypothetical protein
LRHFLPLASGLLMALGLGCVSLTPPHLDPDGGAPDLVAGGEAGGRDLGGAAGGPDLGGGGAGGSAADGGPGDAPADQPGAGGSDAMDAASDGLPSTLGMGLVAYWKMDDNSGTKILDETSNRNDAIIEGAPMLMPGAPLLFANPGAFEFQDLDGAAWAPDTDSLAPPRISMAAWARLDSLTNRGKCGGAPDGLEYIVFRRNVSAGNGITDGVTLLKQPDNHFAFVLRNGNGVTAPAVSTTVAQTGRWYHLAGTFDGNQVRLYVNGMAEGSATYAEAPAYDRAGRLWLARSGECKDMGLGVSNFDGKLAGALDDVRIYNRALAGSEARDLFSGRN